ncbi:pollen-specific leucine-rich repeat extensin-like protein 1 [Galendromus occidentalis]|uniref:Pollen-specific leucine-rich repeat extensin-like protein 1 n=1 Tax=Galendromus occidentalis TaxID=34638 RepID=A0AAJ7L5H9_9ACAR|nr:pollen-specific leucine-rich repeat extensin-like protein 1 [Galendromus occidentalis]
MDANFTSHHRAGYVDRISVMMIHFILLALLGAPQVFGATFLRPGPYGAPIPTPYGPAAPVFAPHAPVAYYPPAPAVAAPAPIVAAPHTPYITSYSYASHINHAVPPVHVAPTIYAAPALPRLAPVPVAYGPPVQPLPAFRHDPHHYAGKLPSRHF